MKTILVTGCCGMIGYITTKKLLSENYNVIGIDNFLSNFNSIHYYQQQCLNNLIKYPNFTFKNVNLGVDKIFNDEIDGIVHLAAYPGIRFSYDNPEIVLKNNQESFLAVLNLATKQKIPIIFASSSSVYGNHDYNTTEKSQTNPLSIYALSKKINEDTAQLFFKLYNTSFIGLRFFTVYGPYNRPDMFVHKIIDSILSQTPLKVYGHGLLKRDFTFNEDVANCIYKLLKHQLRTNDIKSDFFNIGGNNSIELIEFIKSFEHALNKKANLIIIPDKPIYDAQATFCNNKKISNQFPDMKFTNYEKGAQLTAKWFTEHIISRTK